LAEGLFLIGTGKAVITPPLGIPLAGFGSRDHGAESVADDLELRVFWVDAQNGQSEPVCIICADLVGVGEQLVAQIRNDLASSLGIKPDAVFVTASHTHCGPQAMENMSGVGNIDPSYIASLRQCCLQAATTAKQNAQPAVLKAGRGVLTGGYSINRRLFINGQMTMAPNPAGIRDDEVITLAFHHAQSDAVLAVLFNFACHASTLSGYAISGDYPAAARRYIEKALPGAAAGFLQGCCGDIRSNCTFVGGKSFRKGQIQDLQIFGAALGGRVVDLVQNASDSFAPAIFSRTDSARLPLEKEGEYAQLPLQRIDLADKVSLVGLAGEPVTEYGYYIKGLRPGAYTIPVGYANGVIAYIPSARMFAEGGYETHDSPKYFGLPSPFHPSIQAVIQDGIRQLMLGNGVQHR
jgi:hypothetical protein